jgi:hypothetical protein
VVAEAMRSSADQGQEYAAIDAAATVWAVLITGGQVAATAEERTKLAAAKVALDQLLEQLGLSEADLKRHLAAQYPGRAAPLRALEPLEGD